MVSTGGSAFGALLLLPSAPLADFRFPMLPTADNLLELEAIKPKQAWEVSDLILPKFGQYSEELKFAAITRLSDIAIFLSTSLHTSRKVGCTWLHLAALDAETTELDQV